jgi:hypothetical protein
MDAAQVTPPAGSPGPLAVPRRSFLKDLLWVGALGWLVFGPGFSWLATRSRPYESFGENLRTVGIWSGLIFGVILGLVFAYLMRPRSRSFPIGSPEAFRAQLHEALSPSPRERRAPYALRQDVGNEILLHSTSTKVGNRIQEDTLLIRISGDQVTTVGTRFAHSWLRKKMGKTSTRP